MINKKCKKCGYSDTYLRYISLSERAEINDTRIKCLEKYIKSYKFTEEFIYCKCRTCGYCWILKPLNLD